MKPLPHLYKACINGTYDETFVLSANGLQSLDVDAPKEFDGPGDLWSPEELLLGAVANCLSLSFRAIAKASKLDWLSIECSTEGKLDRIEKVTSITAITSTVKLVIAANESVEKAELVLKKADKACMISNSLKATSKLIFEITQK